MDVVNETLREHYRFVHQSKPYGVSGDEFRPHLQIVLAELRPASVLNYGCGQTRLHEEMDLFGALFFRYDPGIPEWSALPIGKADLVVNTDVLEHIPEESLDAVVGHIASISSRALINISTRPASEKLPDGSNAHCTIKSPEAWRELLARHFAVVNLVSVRPGHSCLFTTWDSVMAEPLAMLNEVPDLRKRLRKAQRSGLETLRNELRRFRRRVTRAA